MKYETIKKIGIYSLIAFYTLSNFGCAGNRKINIEIERKKNLEKKENPFDKLPEGVPLTSKQVYDTLDKFFR